MNFIETPSIEWEHLVEHFQILAIGGSDLQPMIEVLEYLNRNWAAHGFRPLSASHSVIFSLAHSYHESRTRPAISIKYLGNKEFRVDFVDAETEGFGVFGYKCFATQVVSLLDAMILRLVVVERITSQQKK